jgi:hypothetical protein
VTPAVPTGWDIATSLGTAVAAAAGAVAAGAAWRSAQLTKRATEASLVSGLLAEYSAPAMSEALQSLHAWAERKGPGFADRWETAWNAGDPEARKVDDARRKVGGYFTTARRLHEHRLISEKSLKMVAAVSGLHAVRDYILELETRVNRNADLKPYHDLFRLCDLERITRPTRGRFGGDKP